MHRQDDLSSSESASTHAAATRGSADGFARRHLGPNAEEVARMLETIGVETLDALIDATVPPGIRLSGALRLPAPAAEHEALAELRAIAGRNRVGRSFLGMGYSGTITPPVIQRNILENPGWYTAYTPYQAEIAQGRLEALLNFQTMIGDLTGLPIANASMLDEATAAAEAVMMCHRLCERAGADTVLISRACHPQTIDVVQARSAPLGIRTVVAEEKAFDFGDGKVFAVVLQYPATDGAVRDYAALIARAHAAGALAVVAADLLALALLRPPGEFGADIAVGSSQRFGVPLGYGGPHAAFFATRDEFKRQMPGRLVGVSRGADGRAAYRLALQTREQHIRREKATSNICTAQVLLAVIASMYAVYHGPEGLRRIARRVHTLTAALAEGLRRLGVTVAHEEFFDTIRVERAAGLCARAAERGLNLRALDEDSVCISLDETTTAQDVADLLALVGGNGDAAAISNQQSAISNSSLRSSAFLAHPVFNTHHTETEMLRYLRRLESRDLSLCHSMIPLGSCTMKLNATSEMLPVTWTEFGALHPFARAEQAQGYAAMFEQLESWLAEITGFRAVSLQPNAGSQGEYTGLLVIRAFHQSRGEGHRNVCLIPQSAHGTNPASAAMAGFRVVPVRTGAAGDIDIDDLRARAAQHAAELACIMVTYPSTHGVFEEGIREVCEIVHAHGGQVYLDGANMNAQVGLCRPGDYGADVCHLNLHKTFCIPHGGGGPGMGPIGVAAHLAPFLPGHPVVATGGAQGIGAVSAAPWGSASILPISWMYIRMMGAAGLADSSRIAILNANYIAARLEKFFPVLYRGKNGRVAHECIVDVRRWEASAGVKVEDIAKRLMDYGFHAPTVSWPVPGTMMIEPTESESKEELDRFCDALIAIHGEMRAIEEGRADRQNNLLKNAPHTAEAVCADKWDRPYSREAAAFPMPWLRGAKFWPAVGRIDNVYGDRHLVCSCLPMD